MATFTNVFQVKCSTHGTPSISDRFHQFKTLFSSPFKVVSSTNSTAFLEEPWQSWETESYSSSAGGTCRGHGGARLLGCDGEIHFPPANDRVLCRCSSSFGSVQAQQPLWRELKKQVPLQMDVAKTMIKNTSLEFANAFVDRVFEFADQPLLPSQSNFAPVDEIGEAVLVTNVEGNIPADFPEGTFIRNGPNPVFGGLKTAKSVFGRTSHIWVEGEGMLHALYLKKDDAGNWTLVYNNGYVQTDTLKAEMKRNKPSFLPTVEGDSAAVLAAYVLNLLRFGKVNKCISNTNVFEHSGKMYSIAESDLPQEIDIHTLENIGSWDIGGTWDRPFTSHPKRAPGTNELVFMGFDAVKPFYQLGVVSADGRKLIHKADLKLERCSLSHEIGVTQRYNVILDFPVTIDINRVIKGGSLIKFDKTTYARIGVMPRYGDAESLTWFEVETNCVFHIINCFEDGDEVIMWACKARGSVLPGPELGFNKYDWFSRGFKHLSSVEENGDDAKHDGLFFTRAYEWRLNMNTGEVKEKHLTGTNFSMDFPMINEKFTGVQNKFGYTQLVDSEASSKSAMGKYGGLAKLYFEESEINDKQEELIRVEYHMFPTNTFCTGSAFVQKSGGVEEDDGWIITYVHNEDSNTSMVYIIDTKEFTSEPVAKITLPYRVPYGFHGTFKSAAP